MYLVPRNYQIPLKITLEILHQKQVICSSDHKAAKIFVKGLVFCKDAGLQL